MNEDVNKFVRSVYRDVDTRELPRLLAHLTQDCTFVFGNAEPVTGHAAIEDFVGGFMGMIAAMEHRTEEAWRAGDAVFARLRVTYTRHDAIQKSYPASVIWRMHGPLIREFRIFVDNSNLFAPQ